MKKLFLLGLGIIGLVTVLILIKPEADLTPLLESTEAKEVTVYKSPTCGCCEIYSSYLEGLGFEVTVENVTDMDPIKQKYNVPNELLSCHTAIIGDYFVEGHVPMEAIEKLLSEQPAIKGIALPNMPSGTPGMPGSKTQSYEIQQVTEDGYSLFLSL